MADAYNRTMASQPIENKKLTGSTGKRSVDADEDDAKRQKLAANPMPKTTTANVTPFNMKSGIRLKLNTPNSSGNKPLIQKSSGLVSSVFNDDSDEEPEEIPREARMRMRNIGRNTPTSSGPNSFGKTKQGFCNMKKVFEKQTAAELADADEDIQP